MPKSIPLRMCTGCRERKPKKELVRVVRSPEGDISVDLTGRRPGRGAYICPDPKCLAKAKKHRLLEKALDTGISEEIYARLLEEIEEAGNEQ